jgi:diacylglycerol kinase family enzyme
VDGERHELSGYSVAVANSKAYGGGMFMAPQAELDDGKLDVVVTGRASKARFLRSLPLVFKGEHLSEPSVSTFRGERIEVAADRPFDVYADGDPVGSVPATISVSPQCLRVIVPA